MGIRSLIGFGIAWGGYLVIYYGWTKYQGLPATIKDLALPSHLPALAAQSAQTSAQKSAATTVPTASGQTVLA